MASGFKIINNSFDMEAQSQGFNTFLKMTLLLLGEV
jgi:hypothetical protein